MLTDVLRRKFSLTTAFVSTTSDLSFTITNVYAPSDHSLTSEFVREMIALAPLVDGPWLSFGGYNLIRYPSEKIMTILIVVSRLSSTRLSATWVGLSSICVIVGTLGQMARRCPCLLG
jgi:hypothetical protein